jgi:copper transport protein
VRRPSLILRRLLVALGVILAVGLAGAAPAWAHAELDTSTPGDQAVVAQPPKEVVLRFTEGVGVQPDGVRVLDSSAERVDLGKATASDDTVRVPLPDDLPDGGYVVAWRVVSADGHPVHGAFQFFVGSRTSLDSSLADRAFGASADRRDEVAGAVLRFVSTLCALAVAGAVLVGYALRRDGDPSPVGRVVAVLAGLGAVAVVAQLPIQASLATGRGWSSIADAGVLDVALGDGVGWSLALTCVGLTAVALTAGLHATRAIRAVSVAGAALAPFGFVVTGHTRTMDPAWAGYAADAVHVAAGAVWFGGLGALWAVQRRRRAAGDVTGAATAVARFSGWAGASLLALVMAGTAMGVIEVGGLSQLTGTTYGKLLVAKVALVALVGAAAAWNRFSFVPAVERSLAGAGDAPDPTRPDPASTDPAPEASEPPVEVDDPPGDGGPHRWTHFDRLLRFELLGIVAVLAVTAVLTNVTPARTAGDRGIVTVRTKLGTSTLEVTIDPARPGRNDVHAYVLDERGAVDDRYDSAEFALALPAQDVGPLSRTPVNAGPGHFQLVGVDLPLKGEWTLTVTVKPDRFTLEKAEVSFRVR